MKRRLRLAAALALFATATGVLIAVTAEAFASKAGAAVVVGVLIGIAVSACVAYGFEQARAYRNELAKETVRQILDDDEEVDELLAAWDRTHPCSGVEADAKRRHTDLTTTAAYLHSADNTQPQQPGQEGN